MEKCVTCNKETDNSIRINDFDGFCQSSVSENICKDCLREKIRFTDVGLFLAIDDKLYHDGIGFGAFKRVRTKFQLDMIFNKDYMELLKYVK